MTACESLNIGIIRVYDVNEFPMKEDVFVQKLENLLLLQKHFVVSTCKRRFIEKNILQLKFFVQDWSSNEDVNLIFIIEKEIRSLKNIVDEDFLSSNLKQLPRVSKLVFPNQEEGMLNSSKYKCFVYKKTIIISFNLSTDHLEYFFDNVVTDIIPALHELTVFSETSCFSNSKSLNEVSSKSRVVPLKVADRPRQSVFPMLSVSDAVSCVLNQSKILSTTWKCTEDSLSYVLADNVIATEPYPPFNASIKDGYAVLAEDETRIRNVIGVVTPGCELDFDMVPGTCVRVSTGSAIPHKADAVIQVEDTAVAEKDSEGNEIKIEIMKQAKKLQDIRLIGSDVCVGEVLIPSKRKISASEIGVLAIAGIQRVLVFQKPWVALLSTGDEVLDPHVPLQPGCIRDSNKSSLMSLLIENKIPFIDAGIARDTVDDIKSHLNFAMKHSNIIVSTGSVSMGEKDLLKSILQQDFDAKIHFGRIHMKPGKPTTFSTATFEGEEKLIFSLPGNPVSAYVCFYLFVIPCIKKLMGFEKPEHKIIKVELAHDIKLDERPEFYRVALRPGSSSTFIAQSTGSQQSSRLLSMQNADALLVLPPKSDEQTSLKAGSLANAIILEST